MSEIAEQLRRVIREELQPIKEQLNRIEEYQSEDVVGLLKILSSKVDRISEGQERQDRILELLSARSIEHEALINELKSR